MLLILNCPELIGVMSCIVMGRATGGSDVTCASRFMRSSLTRMITPLINVGVTAMPVWLRR